ncbi:SAM-dependent methyltransferase [Enemella evansiae]|nr:SAM-dependent methyltransferase [Enemella evansiae]
MNGSCKICAGSVHEFLDLGTQPLSDHFPRRPDEQEYTYLLTFGVCESCAMVQMIGEVPRQLMFNADYPYLSSGSTTMRAHFEATAHKLLAAHVDAAPSPFVAELGCNDGVFLEPVHRAGVSHLGFEPSSSVAQRARAKGLSVTEEFFEADSARSARERFGPAALIYGANTVCHIPYLNSVLEGVSELLDDTGVFVFEDPYLGDVVDKTSFDQIYDEHCFLFSATSVQAMAARVGLDLVDVERLPVHGGEVRYTLARRGSRAAAPAVAELIGHESATGLSTLPVLEGFARQVAENTAQLRAVISDLVSQGQRVVGYGATAKSATVLNYGGLGPQDLAYIVDTTPAKQGAFTPRTHIPIVSPDVFHADPPDVAVLFAWNHEAEIFQKETDFARGGGRWVRYVPTVSWISEPAEAVDVRQ